MKEQLNDRVRETLQSDVGDDVWLDGGNISTTCPCPKFENIWQGPFLIASRVSKPAYKLNILPSSKGIHSVFHVLVLCKLKSNKKEEQKRQTPQPVVADGKYE